MKIFLSYRFTGEEPKALDITLKRIAEALKLAGHETYCSFWDEEIFSEKKYTHRQILEHALKELDKADVYLAFVKSQDKSEGMLMEAGYALAKSKHIVIALKKGITTTFLTQIAKGVIEFNDIEDLCDKLSKENKF